MRMQQLPVFYDEQSAASTQYANMLQGIRNAAARSGVRMQLIAEKDAESVAMDTLAPVAIVASSSMPYIQQIIALLRAHDRRTVLSGLDSEQFGHDISCATPSRRTETQQLVNYLYKCGKKRIALVGFGSTSVNDNFRYHAAMSAAAAWGQILKESDLFLWENDPSESFEAFLPVSGSYDAVICPNDIMSISFINCCRKHGMRVPEDFYVASFGNTMLGGLYRPSITTMTMDWVCVGEQAYQVWRFLMASEGPQNAALKITVPSRILVRDSTCCQSFEMGGGVAFQALEADRFYRNPSIAVLVGLEHCISQRDSVDMRIICGMLDGKSYEQLCDEVYISNSTLRYRLNKIFSDAGVRTRQEFERLIHTQLGEGNPFREA